MYDHGGNEPRRMGRFKAALCRGNPLSMCKPRWNLSWYTGDVHATSCCVQALRSLLAVDVQGFYFLFLFSISCAPISIAVGPEHRGFGRGRARVIPSFFTCLLLKGIRARGASRRLGLGTYSSHLLSRWLSLTHARLYISLLNVLAYPRFSVWYVYFIFPCHSPS